VNQPQGGPRPVRRSRILVVDDTEDIRYFLATLLQDRMK
jgi:CheY-like chemotaxis protein